MNKTNKIISALRLLIKNPSLINLITESNFYWHQKLLQRHSSLKLLPQIDILELTEVLNYKNTNLF